MKCPVLVGKKKIEFQEKAVPAISPGEVLVKVEYCGICGSDFHAWETGTLYPMGTVMGHEFSGVVAEVGGEIASFRPGDPVAVKPSASCLKCHWCGLGKYSLCPMRRGTIIGINAENDGAFAEYVRVRHPDQMLFNLPGNVGFEQAALAEPLSIAFHSVRLSHFKAGDRVMIIGGGAIGLGILQRLKAGGAGKIIVLELSGKKSSIAENLGADLVLNPKSAGDGLKDHILGMTDGTGPDIVFECAGVPAAFQTATDCVKSGGQILLIGLQEEIIPFDAFALLHREVEIKGVLGSYDEYGDVLEYLNDGKIDSDAMISDIIPLDDLVVRGFERLNREKDLIKVMVNHS